MTTPRVLAGRYELLAVIGRGRHGAVWSARDCGTGQRLAAKLLDAAVIAQPHVLERFRRECNVLTAFVHPAIVRVLDLVDADGALAMVMELVEAEDLRQSLDRTGNLPPADAVAISQVLAEALAAAHAAGVVHCDVKPSNILWAGPGGTVRLSDCRVARLARSPSDARFTESSYAAPEVRQGGTPTRASDVYSVGAILHELLTGSPPRHNHVNDGLGHPPGSLADQPELRELIGRCLRPEPTARPTADAVAYHLRNLVLRSPPREDFPDVPPSARASMIAVPSRQPPVRAFVTAATVAVIAIGGGLLGIRGLASAHDGPPAASSPTDGSHPNPLTSGALPNSGSSARPGNGSAVSSPSVELVTAFVNDWFRALSAAVATGSTDDLEAVSSPSCSRCQEIIESIKAAYAQGGTFGGGAYAVRHVTVDGFVTEQHPSVRVVFDRGSRSSLSAAGEVREVLPGGAFLSCQLILEASQAQWRVLEVLTTTSFI